MRNRLLYAFHLQRNKREERKRFRLFILVQCIHYGALLLLLLGGLFCIVVAVRFLIE